MISTATGDPGFVDRMKSIREPETPPLAEFAMLHLKLDVTKLHDFVPTNLYRHCMLYHHGIANPDGWKCHTCQTRVRQPAPKMKSTYGTTSATLIFVSALVPYLWFVVQLDVFAATTDIVSPGFLLIVFLGTPVFALAQVFSRRWMTWACLATLVVIVGLRLTPWHPRKAFVRDVDSIEIGMTVDNVESVMGRYMKGRGAKWLEQRPPSYPLGVERHRATGVMTYRWNAVDGGYDSDWGLVTFENGRVVSAEFLPD